MCGLPRQRRQGVASADLTNAEVISNYRRSITLGASLRAQINGQPHMGDLPVPNDVDTAAIATYLRRISGIEARPRFTTDNYVDALTGYRGTSTYAADCAAGTQSVALPMPVFFALQRYFVRGLLAGSVKG